MGERTDARYVAMAFLAAALYALSTPLSKVLLAEVAPNMMAALLYLGAGLGMGAVWLGRAAARSAGASPATSGAESRLRLDDAPYVVAMVLLDVAAPLLLMAGLARAEASNVALLNNFEIVATSVIALLAFGERVEPRVWAGIAVITVSCMLLSLEGDGALRFSVGSLAVLGACLCWGVENNCTNRLSERDPVQVVVVKGLGSGAGAMVVALLAGDALPVWHATLPALALGFVAYGLSILLYVSAQRGLGAARTSAYYGREPLRGRGPLARALPHAPCVDVRRGARAHGARRVARHAAPLARVTG